jgi:hypothetical protein
LTNEFVKTIFARRSIRNYTEQPVSEGDLKTLLEAAMAAPSASNRKPWHFVVVYEREPSTGWRTPTVTARCSTISSMCLCLRRYEDLREVLGTGLFRRHGEPAPRSNRPRPGSGLAGSPPEREQGEGCEKDPRYPGGLRPPQPHLHRPPRGGDGETDPVRRGTSPQRQMVKGQGIPPSSPP